MSEGTRVTIRYLLPELDTGWMASADDVLDYLAEREGGRCIGSGITLEDEVRDRQYEFPGLPTRFLAEVHGQGMKTEGVS